MSCSIEITSGIPIMPGANLRGWVVCTFPKSTIVKEIKVQFYGDEVTEMLKSTRSRAYGKNILVNVEKRILGPDMELPEGVSKHAFDIELVNRLPSSFRSYHGEIKYFLKAYVKRHFKIDLTSLQTINLVHFVDLNTYLPALQIKAEYSTDRVVSNFCGLNRGRIMLNAEVGKRLFLKGEIINLDINIINLSGVTVKCVFGRIMKTLTIYFDKPFLTEETFRDFVTKSRDFQGVKKYSETSYSLYIEIPPDLFVPNLRHSKLFKTTYQVQVVVKLSGCNTSMVLQFKIYLGHIPLSGIPMKPQRKGPYIRDDTTDSCTSFKL